ncbi:unnamed protein product [Coccothraustes coccothraustes]
MSVGALPCRWALPPPPRPCRAGGGAEGRRGHSSRCLPPSWRPPLPRPALVPAPRPGIPRWGGERRRRAVSGERRDRIEAPTVTRLAGAALRDSDGHGPRWPPRWRFRWVKQPQLAAPLVSRAGSCISERSPGMTANRKK